MKNYFNFKRNYLIMAIMLKYFNLKMEFFLKNKAFFIQKDFLYLNFIKYCKFH